MAHLLARAMVIILLHRTAERWTWSKEGRQQRLTKL